FLLLQEAVGIRDYHVTGVQTCAIPIWRLTSSTTPDSIYGRRMSSRPNEWGMYLTCSNIPASSRSFSVWAFAADTFPTLRTNGGKSPPPMVDCAPLRS